MSRSERWLSRAIDAHVQGIHHPNAPWNQPDLPLMCENCDKEECNEPCEALKKHMEDEYKAQQEADDAMYFYWLTELPLEDLLIHAWEVFSSYA